MIVSNVATYVDLAANTKQPTIIFLHGIGEKGDGTEAGLSNLQGFINSPANNIIPNLNKFFNGEQFNIIAPQLLWSDGEWRNDYIDKAYNYALTLPEVDPERIALVGISLGGGGVLKYLSVAGNGQKFNVAVPICPAYNTHDPKVIAGSGIATWFFHASDDPTCNVATTNSAVSNINSNNPAVPAFKTIYDKGGHYIWGTAFGTEALWLWMQKNTKTKRISPMATSTTTETPVSGLKANAGADQVIQGGATTLDGSLSTGYKQAWWDHTSFNGKWPPASYWDGEKFGIKAKLKDLPVGDHEFKLTVSDTITTSTDTVKVTVQAGVGTPTTTAPTMTKELLFTLKVFKDGSTEKV